MEVVTSMQFSNLPLGRQQPPVATWKRSPACSLVIRLWENNSHQLLHGRGHQLAV